jgi:hypothetical protein
MEKKTEFKGQNGVLIVYDECVAISRKSFGGFISQGASSGERKYYYKDINGIEYKKPTIMANGYFKIIIAGSAESNAKVGILGSSKESMQDQNTVVLRAFNKKVGQQTDEIYELVMEKISSAKSKNTGEVSTKMDELKKLGELKASGVLTDEEFQIEKAKLLND